MFRVHTYKQFDGAEWREYQTNEALFVLTSRGRNLFSSGGLSAVLRDYAADATHEHQTGDSPEKTRHFLAQGGNAKVYTVNDHRLVIKERKAEGDQLIPGLKRMDRLTDAVEKHCPRYIDTPEMYGAMIMLADPDRQYLLMEKIDDGVTAGDIISLYNGEEPREPGLAEAVTRNFGMITEEFAERVNRVRTSVPRALREALHKESLDADLYLPDIDNNPHNILVEKQTTPIAGSNLKFWVIDQ